MMTIVHIAFSDSTVLLMVVYQSNSIRVQRAALAQASFLQTKAVKIVRLSLRVYSLSPPFFEC